MAKYIIIPPSETLLKMVGLSYIWIAELSVSCCMYPASKSAVNGLTRSLSRELGQYGIKVNSVAPGVTRTDMIAALPESMVAPLLQKIPLARMGEAEDIANAALFLASDMASYITGAIIPVDGGAII